MVRSEGCCHRFWLSADQRGHGFLLNDQELSDLFEPIPRPLTVTIPLQTAKFIQQQLLDTHQMELCQLLAGAIEWAERKE